MKVGIAGAGAVGSFFGAILQKADHEVVFLARGKHLQAMKQNGLIVKNEDESFSIRSTFTDDLNDLSECELILLCVKANDTEQIAKQLLPILTKDALILTMQNGVDNEETLSRIFGSERILSCATYVQISIDAPGIINQQGRVKLVIGELDNSVKNLCSKIITQFQQAGLDIVHTENILEKKWRKLLWNITFNPLSAISTAKVGEILDDKHLRETAESICREAIEVAQEVGIMLDSSRTMETIFANAERAKTHKTSMLQDRISGKQMEVESVCGFVIRKAEELKLQVPTIQAAYGILSFYNEKQSISSDKLITK